MTPQQQDYEPHRKGPADMQPGDQAPPGTPGTGRIGEHGCDNCGGTGVVIEGIGGG